MNVNQLITIVSSKDNSGSGYKVLEINMADPTQNLYAVVSPVKTKD